MQISILCSQIGHAKKLRDILKKCSALCYVHTDFEEFWQYSQNDLSHLYLLDVEMACGEERSIIDHPRFQSRQMNVAFYYSQNSLALMSANYRLNSLGDFDIEAIDLPQVLSQIISALKIKRGRENEILKLKAELYQTQQQHDRFVAQVQRSAEESDYRKLLREFIHKVDQKCLQFDFLPALSKVIAATDFVRRYTIFELTHNGQKLISPRLKGKKYRSLPALWLGIDHGNEGIQQYAQGLAHQVAVDYLGGEIITIGPKMCAENLPVFLIYLEVEPDICHGLDWNLLQLFLGGLYSRSLLRERDRSYKSSHFVSLWEFFDLLVVDGAIEEDPCHILVLEFHRLVKAVTHKGDSDFQWRRFYEEFTTRLDAKIKYDYFSSCLGRWGMAFFVSGDQREALETLLKQFSQEFSYWKFFEDPDEILILNLDPQIKALSASQEEFFQYMAHRDREDANKYISQNRMEAETLERLARVLKGPALEI